MSSYNTVVVSNSIYGVIGETGILIYSGILKSVWHRPIYLYNDEILQITLYVKIEEEY